MKARQGTQRWFLRTEGRTHVVEVQAAGWGRRLVWRLDDHEVVSTRSSDDRVSLTPGDDAPADAGVISFKFPAFGPARRVTWHAADDAGDAEAAALIGVGGLDFEPEPGSAAARRDAWIRAHPRIYTVRQTLVAAFGVVVPLVLAALVARFAFSLGWPDWDLPRIPWPDLPAIPGPDVPWPDLPRPDLPALPDWLRSVLDKVKYVGPIVIAFLVARAEIRRKRKQAEGRSLDSGHDDGPHRPRDDRDGR